MKKIAYIIACIALLTGIIITVQSCMQTNETGDNATTEADKFIASSEYQTFLANERKDDYEKAQLIIQLPEDQYNKFMQLNQKILETDGYDGKLALMKAMSKIVGYDIPKYLQNKAEARYKMFEGKNFSPEEIMRAEIKYEYKYIANVKTRTTEKKEDLEGYQKCIQTCGVQHDMDMLDCAQKYGMRESRPKWECQANASAKRTNCLAACKKRYL